jgi:hypothetical protein
MTNKYVNRGTVKNGRVGTRRDEENAGKKVEIEPSASQRLRMRNFRLSRILASRIP